MVWFLSTPKTGKSFLGTFFPQHCQTFQLSIILLTQGIFGAYGLIDGFD